MEPFNVRFHETIMKRWTSLDDDEKRAAFAFLAGAKPALTVRAMDYAQRLAEEVDETLSQV